MAPEILSRRGSAELDDQINIERKRVIQRYPPNYFIFQHRDLYSKTEEPSKAEKRLICQNPLETLKSRKRGDPELYFQRYKYD